MPHEYVLSRSVWNRRIGTQWDICRWQRMYRSGRLEQLCVVSYRSLSDSLIGRLGQTYTASYSPGPVLTSDGYLRLIQKEWEDMRFGRLLAPKSSHALDARGIPSRHGTSDKRHHQQHQWHNRKGENGVWITGDTAIPPSTFGRLTV